MYSTTQWSWPSILTRYDKDDHGEFWCNWITWACQLRFRWWRLEGACNNCHQAPALHIKICADVCAESHSRRSSASESNCWQIGRGSEDGDSSYLLNLPANTSFRFSSRFRQCLPNSSTVFRPAIIGDTWHAHVQVGDPVNGMHGCFRYECTLPSTICFNPTSHFCLSKPVIRAPLWAMKISPSKRPERRLQ